MSVVENHLEVLNISLEDIQGKSDKDIAKFVKGRHTELYQKTTGAGANRPRKDGLTNKEYQEKLNAARKTLTDPTKRTEFIAKLSADEAEEKSQAANEADERARRAAQNRNQGAQGRDRYSAEQAKADQARKAAQQARDQAARAAAQAKKTAQQAAAKVGRYIVNGSGIILAIGVGLTTIGVALLAFQIYEGGLPFVLSGLLLLPCGFTGFLYRGGGRRAVIFAFVGVVMLVGGFVMMNYPMTFFDAFPVGQLLRILGGGALICNFVAVVLKYFFESSESTLATGTIAYIASKWTQLTSTWIPLVRYGAAAIVIAVLLFPLDLIFQFLIGFGPFGGINQFLFLGGLALIAFGFFRGRRF